MAILGAILETGVARAEEANLRETRAPRRREFENADLNMFLFLGFAVLCFVRENPIAGDVVIKSGKKSTDCESCLLFSNPPRGLLSAGEVGMVPNKYTFRRNFSYICRR